MAFAWRDYVSMNCGSCYASSFLVREASFYTCTTCGAPSFRCEKCVELADAYELTAVTTTCATCSILKELAT
jgi:predicted RNA-binding Zn-ribbon protein involved in translation (DUF1610 family)